MDERIVRKFSKSNGDLMVWIELNWLRTVSSGGLF
jgi:hypothetical protein